MPTLRPLLVLPLLLLATSALSSGAAARAQCPSLADVTALVEAEPDGDARTAFAQAIEADDGCAEAHYGLGRLLLRASQWEAAAERFDRAIALDASVSDYHLYYARSQIGQADGASMLRRSALARRARRALLRAVELDPGNAQARATLGGYYLTAPPIAGGSRQRAREQAGALVPLDPRLGYDLWVRIHLEAGEDAEAEEAYRRLLGLSPNDVELLYTVGMFYVERERYGRALDLLDRARTADPPHPYTLWALYQFGATTARAGARLDEGLDALQRFLRLNAERAEPVARLDGGAWWRTGMIHESRGDLDAARQAYERSVTLYPASDNEAHLALARLAGDALSPAPRPDTAPEAPVTFHYEDLGRFAEALSAIEGGTEPAVAYGDYLAAASPGFQAWMGRYNVSPSLFADRVPQWRSTYEALPALGDDLRRHEAVIRGGIEWLRDATGIEIPIPVYYFVSSQHQMGGTPVVLGDGGGVAIAVGVEVGAGGREVDEAETAALLAQVAVHEAAHIFQVVSQGGIEPYRSIYDPETGSMLAIAVREGCAEYVTFLASGQRYGDRHEYVAAHERALWEAFKAIAAAPPFSVPGWFDGVSSDDPDRPFQVGYALGARMCESYHLAADDPDARLAELFALYDADDVRRVMDAYEAALADR